MQKVLFSLVLLVLLCGVLRADTLYLRDGSVLQGTFIGYENGQFVFQIAGGGERGGQRLEFPARDVARLVIDHQNTAGERPDPRNEPRSESRGDPPPMTRGTGKGSGAFDSYPPIEVALKDEWVRSEIEVERGQRIKVEASGQIYLEGRTASPPEGLSRRDPSAPSPNDPDGALIAGVGKDDSSVILIGRSREFTADRDGMLYFSVNHGEAKNARGAYQVRISLERMGDAGGNVSGGNTSGNTSRDTGGGNAGRGGAPVPNSNVRERLVTIYANRGWQDTGIDLQPGMTLEVVASGTINIGANRRVDPRGDQYRRGNSSRVPLPREPAGALIAKIRYRQGGDSNVLLVSTQNTLTVEQGEYGRLLLGINDDDFNDNSGAFTVRIRW